jgi:hypothetical protein
MNLNPNHSRPAPLRVLFQLIFRERAVRGPAAIELDVFSMQLGREQSMLRTRAEESTVIENHLEHMRNGIAAALNDAATPGVITLDESRTLCGELIDTSLKAHAHTEQLKGMAS